MGRLTERDKHEQGIWVDTQEIGDLDKWVEPFENIYPAINKLAHYEDLEEQGRLIEQKHGQWIANKHMVKSPTAENYHCSECTQTGKRTQYCPNCGAKMELKELEG